MTRKKINDLEVQSQLTVNRIDRQDVDAQESESLRIAMERIDDLENGLTTLHLQFGEPYYSWQRVLYRVQQLIRRRNACVEACLNAIGFIAGETILTKEEITQRLVDAVTMVVSGEEPPEFRRNTEKDDLLDTVRACLIAAGADEDDEVMEFQCKMAGNNPSDFVQSVCGPFLELLKQWDVDGRNHGALPVVPLETIWAVEKLLFITDSEEWTREKEVSP